MRSTPLWPAWAPVEPCWRSPVIITGCCFEGDGMNKGAGGEFAGSRVQGRNRVFIDGTIVMVNTLDASTVAWMIM
jgi:hypothetical protein